MSVMSRCIMICNLQMHNEGFVHATSGRTFANYFAYTQELEASDRS